MRISHRQDIATAEALPAPTIRLGPLRWLKENLFSTWYNALLTLLAVGFLYITLRPTLEWAFFHARWDVIPANLKLLLVGIYPAEHVWRVWICVYWIVVLLGVSGGLWGGLAREAAVAVGSAGIFLLLLPFSWAEKLWIAGLFAGVFGGLGLGWLLRKRKSWRKDALILWALSPLVIFSLLGGWPGSPLLLPIGTNQWGGLLLTFMLAIVGILTSFPLGILLALGRQSNLPVIRWISISYIEVVRGVPLITVIFMTSIMLPLFLPPQVRVDQAVRAIVAFTLFTAAYIAENVRGGLQAVPRGQIEAAKALGLSGVLTTLFIVLPQALRAVIPANVGQFISLFKDTALVFVASLLDLFGIARSILANPDWLGRDREILLFIALVYWIFAYFMSHMSRRLEKALGVGER
jgi:general L-amino acid transport system permease protein